MSEKLKDLIEKLKYEKNPKERSIITGEIVRILQEYPKGFYENSGFLGESIPLFVEDLVGPLSNLDDEGKKTVMSSFLSHTAVVEIILAEGTMTYSSRKYFQDYFNENFATIYKNLNSCIELDGREEAVVQGFRESLLKGIVSKGIIIDKDGNLQTKNDEKLLDNKTAKDKFYYSMDEEFVKEILKNVYNLERYTDVENFWNNIDTILGEDIQREGTVINSLCNCSGLGNVQHFREADDIYGPNFQFEYLKSLMCSVIVDRLEKIKEAREDLVGGANEKRIEDMLNGRG